MTRYFQFCPIDGRRFADGELICMVCGTDRDVHRFFVGATPVNSASRSPIFMAPPVDQGDAENEMIRKPWRKLLYIKQDYPDNYVDHTFLEEMQKNANVRSYDYWDTVKESSVITQQLSSIIIFVSAFIHIYSSRFLIQHLIILGGVLTVSGYIYWYGHFGSKDPSFRNTSNNF